MGSDVPHRRFLLPSGSESLPVVFRCQQVFHFFGRISAVVKCDATTRSCAFDALGRLPGHVSVHVLGRIVPDDPDGREPREVAQDAAKCHALDKTITGNNSDSNEAATGVDTHAKQTRDWRFDKDIPTPTANFFSVTRFELMHIITVETR